MYRLLAQVSFDPTFDGLPGGSAIKRISDTLGSWALTACLVGLFVSVVAMALGSHNSNYAQSTFGRRGVIISALGALLIGAGPSLVNFFYNTGRGL